MLLQDLSGPPLGAVPGLRYAQHEVVLPAGTTLIGFTDGLIERRHLPLDDGLHTLLANLRSHLPTALHDPDHLAQAVLDSAPAGTRNDDTAVLIVALPRPDDPGAG
jgi:serine phosphatase RsbU (regulator of sigma subunit)